MKIFDQQNKLLLEVVVDDNSYRNRAIMGDHNLTLYYSLPEHIEIPVGAFCIYEGETYTLMRPENLKMKHTRLYEYTIVFSSEQEKAKIWKFRNPVDGRLKFPLTAKPKEHLQMLVDNMNRRDTGWTLGDCIEDVEKLISYDHDFCWDALGKIANEFQTEFEIVGKRVSLKKVEYNKSQPLPLAYGKGNGFKPGVGRSNSSDALPVEILFVQGGDTNIDRSKYPSEEDLRAISNGCLLLPTGQTIGYDGEHFEGEEQFNPSIARHYQVDDLGLSIRNIDRAATSMAEDSLDRSDDYPKRIGTISEVVLVDEQKNFYDIIDSSIPADLNYEDYQIGEEKMTIIFQSGELAGKEFEVKYYHKAKTINGVKKAGKRFEIVPQEIDGVMMPGGTFVPKTTDTYAVFNVTLPDSYIRDDETKSGASWDMFKAAVRYLFDHEEKKFSFTGELDPIWAKRNWLNVGGKIRLGGFIKFTHEQIAPEGVLARITNIKDYVSKPHSPKIEISNDTISASVSTTLKTLASTEVVIEENHRSALQFTKRRFRDAKETIEMIESALSDNFTDRINPIAVETMSLLVGDERLQYQFVEAPGSMTAVPHNITFHEDTKQLEAPAGTIQHLTLGIDSIRPSHEPNEYLYWNVGSFISPVLTDGNARYYLYIRAQKQYSGAAGSAEFRLETITHKLEEGSYYWLLVGVLNTEYDGERSFATLYGFTEILPGRITADRLLASDGESYFDMLNAAMKLKDKLVFNKDGDGELRIKGVIVQSQNGVDEAPLGCYRGEYNSSTTYFEGDEVTYKPAADRPKSSYRCISHTPLVGVVPTDTLKWQVIAAGTQGNFTEYRFAVNGNTTEYPEINKEDPTPVGWSTDMPTVNAGYYLWMTKAQKIGDGSSLVGKWSIPIRMTAKDGDPGKQGLSPALVYRGDYEPNGTYYGTEHRIDCVRYGGAYYVVATSVGGAISHIIPTNNRFWNQFGSSFESVATGLLLAENANIANLIFRNQRLESSASTNGVPNFFIDGLQNVASFAAGNAVFDGDKAKIGWLEVRGQELIGYDENALKRLIVTPNELPASNENIGIAEILIDWNAAGTNDGNTHNVHVGVSGSSVWADAQISGENGNAQDSFTFYFDIKIPQDTGITQLVIPQLTYKTLSIGSNTNGLQNIGNNVTCKKINGKTQQGLHTETQNGETHVSISEGGTYRIQIETIWRPITQVSSENWSGSVIVECGGLYHIDQPQQTIIARDGLLLRYNTNEVRIDPQNGMTITFGDTHVRINAGGFMARRQSETWNNLIK